MTNAIGRDLNRFKDIVKGKVRDNLRKYISHGEMIGRKGRDTVSIPIPRMDLPHFTHGKKGSGGIGQGDGEIGDPIGKGNDQDDGTGQTGDQEGSHVLEVEMQLDELAKMLGETLELPAIEPKGKNSLETQTTKKMTPYHGQLDVRLHRGRTFKQALKRHMASGHGLVDLSGLTIERRDKWNKDFQMEPNPEANAAVVHMMDVSGSVTDEMKEMVRTEAFWIDTWLKHTYKGLVQKYIIFDAKAKEVDEHTFYHTRESGGTKVSSALKEFKALIERELPPNEWNIYGLLYSDGDNWGEDNKTSIALIEELVEVINMFGYTQTTSPYGSGEFIKVMKKLAELRENIRAHEIESKDDIPDALKTLFGKSRVMAKA